MGSAKLVEPTGPIRRLQLGTSRLEVLPDRVLPAFLDPSWVHLGERPGDGARARKRWFRRRLPATRPELYHRTNFVVYYYRTGWILPFRDASFDFAFAEHFFEHLFLDDALRLFRECYRTLRPGGVLRVLVPDADLRTYEAPEPAGFGAAEGRRRSALEWTHPNKHKSRWSIRSLPCILELAGFRPVPLTWCSPEGELHQRNPADVAGEYGACRDPEMVRRTDYFSRPLSLVVDAARV
jgi:SAM-dependent methyltransferase